MKKFLLIAATALILLCALDLYWWLKNALTLDSFNETLSAYLSVFPKSLQDGRLLSNLRLLVLMFSITALIYLIAKQYKLFITIVILVPASLMFVWTLFSLM